MILKAKMSHESIATPYAKLWGRTLPTPGSASLSTLRRHACNSWLSHCCIQTWLVMHVFCYPFYPHHKISLFYSWSVLFYLPKMGGKLVTDKPLLFLLANISPCLGFELSTSELSVFRHRNSLRSSFKQTGLCGSQPTLILNHAQCHFYPKPYNFNMDHKNSLHLSTHPKYKIQHTELHWKKVWQFLLKLPYDPAILILGIYPREMKTYVHIDIK